MDHFFFRPTKHHLNHSATMSATTSEFCLFVDFNFDQSLPFSPSSVFDCSFQCSVNRLMMAHDAVVSSQLMDYQQDCSFDYNIHGRQTMLLMLIASKQTHSTAKLIVWGLTGQSHPIHLLQTDILLGSTQRPPTNVLRWPVPSWQATIIQD